MSVSQAAKYADLGIDLSSIPAGLSEGHWLNALFDLLDAQLIPTMPQASGLHVRYEFGFGLGWQTPTIDTGIGSVLAGGIFPPFTFPTYASNLAGTFQVVVSNFEAVVGYPSPDVSALIYYPDPDDGTSASTFTAPLSDGDSFSWQNWYYDATVPVVAGSTRWQDEVAFNDNGFSFDIDVALVGAPTFAQWFNMFPDPSWTYAATNAGAMLDKMIQRATQYQTLYP